MVSESDVPPVATTLILVGIGHSALGRWTTDRSPVGFEPTSSFYRRSSRSLRVAVAAAGTLLPETTVLIFVGSELIPSAPSFERRC